MSELTEKEIAIKNEGRMANIVYGNIRPIIESQINDVIAKIKQAYRAGTAEHVKLLAYAAELCTLEDMENKLRQKMSASERLAKKEETE